MNARELLKDHFLLLQPLNRNDVQAITQAGLAQPEDFVMNAEDAYWCCLPPDEGVELERAILFVNTSKTATARCLAVRPDRVDDRERLMENVARQLVDSIHLVKPSLDVEVRYFDDDSKNECMAWPGIAGWDPAVTGLVKVKEYPEVVQRLTDADLQLVARGTAASITSADNAIATAELLYSVLPQICNGVATFWTAAVVIDGPESLPDCVKLMASEDSIVGMIVRLNIKGLHLHTVVHELAHVISIACDDPPPRHGIGFSDKLHGYLLALTQLNVLLAAELAIIGGAKASMSRDQDDLEAVTNALLTTADMANVRIMEARWLNHPGPLPDGIIVLEESE